MVSMVFILVKFHNNFSQGETFSIYPQEFFSFVVQLKVCRKAANYIRSRHLINGNRRFTSSCPHSPRFMT